MQYQVPQFIEVEDTILLGLSFKQLAYVGSGLGILYLSFRFIPWTPIALLVGMIFGGFFFLIAFYRFNERPFLALVDSALQYISQTRLYIWKRKPKDDIFASEVSIDNLRTISQQASANPLHLKGSKLGDLSWQIDVKGSATTDEKVTHG